MRGPPIDRGPWHHRGRAQNADLARDVAVRGCERAARSCDRVLGARACRQTICTGISPTRRRSSSSWRRSRSSASPLDSRARRHSPAPLASLAIVAFVAQEHLERLIHTGQLPFLLTTPGAVARDSAAVAPRIPRLDRRAAPCRGSRRPEPARHPPRRTGRFALGGRRFSSVCLGCRPRRIRAAALPSPPDAVHAAACPAWRSTRHTQEDLMRKTLIVAFALLAIAVPAAATAQPTAVKPVVISINVVNGRPVGGIKRPSDKEGPHGPARRPDERRYRSSPARLRHREGREEGVADRDPVRGEGPRPLRGRAPSDPDSLLAQLTVKP